MVWADHRQSIKSSSEWPGDKTWATGEQQLYDPTLRESLLNCQQGRKTQPDSSFEGRLLTQWQWL